MHDHLFGPFLSKLSISVSISSLLTAVLGAYKHLTSVPFPNFHLSCPAYAYVGTHTSALVCMARDTLVPGTPGTQLQHRAPIHNQQEQET